MFILDLPCNCGQHLRLQSDQPGDFERQVIVTFLVNHKHCRTYTDYAAMVEFYSHWGATGEMGVLVPNTDNGIRLAYPSSNIEYSRRLMAAEVRAMRESERGR